MAGARITSRVMRTGAPRAAANGHSSNGSEFIGPVRLGKRTKHLVKRLGPEDIAVIDHAGIDRVSGEDLVASGVRYVVNVARSASERYANQGPLIITEGGVKLVDMPEADLFEQLEDGQTVTLRDGALMRGGELIAE